MDIEKHVTVLAILHIGLSALCLLGAGVAFLSLLAGGIFSGEPEAFFITSTVGILIAGVLVVLAIPGIVGGIGLLKRRPWARIVVLVLGFLHLLNFPLGTLLGIYTIWVLMRDEAVAYFAESPALA